MFLSIFIRKWRKMKYVLLLLTYFLFTNQTIEGLKWARGIHIDALRRKAAWIDRWYAGVGSGAVARSVNVQEVPEIGRAHV